MIRASISLALEMVIVCYFIVRKLRESLDISEE